MEAVIAIVFAALGFMAGVFYAERSRKIKERVHASLVSDPPSELFKEEK